jgi:hypothetical protein
VALKALKKSILASVWSSKRKEFTDRGIGTLKDIYTPSQVPQHTAAAWVGLSDGKKPNYGCMLRTNVDFLLGNHMLLRSSNRRPLELPDYFRLELPNEGVKGSAPAPSLAPALTQKTYAFVVVMNKGKTNQHGRMEYGAALRHRDPLACLVSALAFWFFYRWQVEKDTETFPSFARPEDWYEIKVLRTANSTLTTPLSGQTANDWTSRLYKACGIKVSKVSYAPRVTAAQTADINGVSEIQVCQ